MGLTRLSLTDFRNLKPVTLEFNPRLNLIYGDNGSGKSSLLEAIHILCLGKSFRNSNLDTCIQHGKESFLLVARFDCYRAGISRDKKKTEIRVDGQAIRSASEFVERTPVVVIDAKSFELVNGPPANRRTYIDWCLFHVEHPYRKIWREYTRALKQKNQLLRSKQNLNQLDYWNEHLSKLCIQINSYRQRYIDEVLALLDESELIDLENHGIEFEYKPGWKTIDDPMQDFQRQKDREIRYGFSIVGSHRDRLNIKANKKAAIEVLSRGQAKRLAMAMIMAQVQLLQNKTGKRAIACVDDLAAELDFKSRTMVLDALKKLSAQLFITNTEAEGSTGLSSEEYQMFHVEHGMIKPVQNS